MKLPDLDRFEVRLAFAVLVAAIIGVSWALRPNPDEQAKVQAALISEDEGRAHRAWKEIRATAGESRESAEVERIVKEVLPPWKAARERVAVARSGPLANYFSPEMLTFFQRREESWWALVESVRTEDPVLFRRHVELWEEAEEVGLKVQQLRVPSGSPVVR
jgi:hypothetical protein